MADHRITLEEVTAFLLGEAPLEGVWFGDRHPTKKGAFWWRKSLSEALSATQEGARVPLTEMPLSRIDELAKGYAVSYASPHHMTFTVIGLRAMFAELAEREHGIGGTGGEHGER